MEKRVILAFVLSFLVLYAFRALYTPPANPEPPASVNTSPVAEAKTNPSLPAPTKAGESAPVVPHENVAGEKAEEPSFETPLYTATFSNVGGVLKSFKLKRYLDGEGQPLELINQETANKVGWPLTLETGDKAVDEQLRSAKFAVDRDAKRLILEFAGNGLYARKALQFDQENYVFVLETKLTRDGKDVPYNLLWLGGFGDQSKDPDGTIPQDPAKKNAKYQVDAAFKKVALASLKDQPQMFMSLRAGVEDQYFLAMLLYPGQPTTVTIRKQEYPGADGKPVPTLALSTTATNQPIRVYVGPKQRAWLTMADPQLAGALDYGFWEFIAKPLVAGLLWIHSYIGNFGWSIIVLTVVLNLVLFPLRLKQQVSMLKMQKIQPLMRRLQDQYKKLKASDPRRAQVQAEMMGLYKEHGVNPMGGCLPLLLQMPLLFGFYSALAYSIELRRAPWILWVKDLSRPDHIHIASYGIPVLALLMAISMFVQQKLTPTTNVDPAQAKMMMIMPLMFTFMFWSQSSGLVLYWLTGSVIGIAQQVFINKYWSPQAEAKLARSRPKESRAE